MFFRELFEQVLNEIKKEDIVIEVDFKDFYINSGFVGIKYVYDDKKNKGEYRSIFLSVHKKGIDLDEIIIDFLNLMNDFEINYKKQHKNKDYNWKDKITFNDKFISKKQKEMILKN